MSAAHEASPAVDPAPQAAPARRRAHRAGLINLAFVVGILLAIFCLGIAAFYLLRYLDYATGALQAINQSNGQQEMLILHMYMSRVLLQSCGLAVGMAFGFLGFSLFLLGVDGNIDASATSGGGVGLQVARLSPGAFVMLCSAILVGICATRDVNARLGQAPAHQAGSPAQDEDANRYSNTRTGAAEAERNYDDVPADGDAGGPRASVVR
jgi:hypothetical protein